MVRKMIKEDMDVMDIKEDMNISRKIWTHQGRYGHIKKDMDTSRKIWHQKRHGHIKEESRKILMSTSRKHSMDIKEDMDTKEYTDTKEYMDTKEGMDSIDKYKK